MRIPLPSFRSCLALSVLTAVGSAQKVEVDTYWQRQSGAKEFDDIAPFRSPAGVKATIPGQLRDLLTDLQEMRRLANEANQLQLTIDEDGREICSISQWAKAYENVKANSLKMSGWLGVVMRESDSRLQRATAIYGMVYFNDPQQVIELIMSLPGEPVTELREDGFQRAIRFMKAHYHKSKPQNPKFPDNGVVVPRYDFNPLPFFMLLDQEKNLDKAQGLWFLTEVLRIRPDLGRAYLEEIREKIPALLLAKDQMVRQRAVEFLSAIERKRDRVKKSTAEDAALKMWLKDLEYDLFPPIRHRSLGLVELYPSDDLEKVVKVGKSLLVDSMLPKGSAKMNSGSWRYGVRIARLPEPLGKLGLPRGAVIVGINAQPVNSAQDVRRILQQYFAQFEPKKPEPGKVEKPQRKLGTPTIQVEYIQKGKALMKEFRLIK